MPAAEPWLRPASRAVLRLRLLESLQAIALPILGAVHYEYRMEEKRA